MLIRRSNGIVSQKSNQGPAFKKVFFKRINTDIKNKVKEKELPKISVVIPCYGEEIEAIKHTVKSIIGSGYKGETEIFVINDGKWDDKTFFKVKKDFEKLSRPFCNVMVLRNAKNLQKANTLNHGFQLATGDLYFCVDADSRVAHGAIEKVVQAFIDNPSVGAVGGWVQIRLNKKGLTKLQEIEYWTNQYIFRTLQNVSGSILCIPGPLSAFRGELARDISSYTFSLTPDFKRNIKKGKIDRKLRNAFSAKKIKLTNYARIYHRDIDRWELVDGMNKFIIKNIGTQYNVYQVYNKMTLLSDRTIVEDEDLTKQIVGMGYKTMVVPGTVYTDCPQSTKKLVIQRKRWFYGNYQAWRENKKELSIQTKWGFKWGMYNYYTWATGLTANCLFLLTLILSILVPETLLSLSLRFIVVIGIFLILRGLVILEHPYRWKLFKQLPMVMLYDIFMSLLASYLFIRYISKNGEVIRWGGKTICAI
jgi:cellulose synthase/poly-beta-1,6-N-acetylglucosamine synthase-like glycosyltransferase